MATRRTVITAAYGGLLVAAALGAALSSRTEDQAPLPLVGLLFVLAAGSELLNVEIRELRLSGSFVSFVLAMALLGPAPAAALCAACALLDSATARRSFEKRLVNVATYTVLRSGRRARDATARRPLRRRSTDPLWFAAAVFGIFMAANALNFLLIATYAVIALGVPARTLRGSFVTTLPSIRDGAAHRRRRVRVRASRHRVGRPDRGDLLRLPLHRADQRQAEERGEELMNERAAGGDGDGPAVDGPADALDARRHDRRPLGPVARGDFGAEVAVMLGLDERAQDLIHTAALLHDIGKFIFPDSILFADRKLTDEEWEIDQAAPGAGRQARPTASRATARSPTSSCATTSAYDGKRLPARHRAARRSRSARASSPSPTPTT